jgi:hypothetical protein
MRELAREGESPLELMLRVMRDENEKIERRLDAATAAAPYMHSKMPIAAGGADPQPLVFDTQALAGLSTEEKITLLALFEKIESTAPHQLSARKRSAQRGAHQ